MKMSVKNTSKGLSGILPVAFAAVATVFLLGGCLSASQLDRSAQTSIAPPPAPAETPRSETPQSETPNRLSYGAITTSVKKDTTTQAELVDLFGGPNIATLDSDGTETWVYEKTASETTTTTNRQAVTTQAERLDVYFGLGLLRKGTVRKGTGATQSSGDTTVSHSIKTLTVIIKFNQNKTVKDFSARASYF